MRANDNTGWMMIGNLYLMNGNQSQGVAAYEKARDTTAVGLFENNSTNRREACRRFVDTAARP